ncbi:hypothetical protein [Ornithinimicrobium cerasi]|uniref:hypothetical protein n=1 Tax=Ornithinimicrobium cerasi TaxID=2248773 RepID=UPI000EFE98AA|nr:hypothetical protein [Ornithinimicrobium cerasi]
MHATTTPATTAADLLRCALDDAPDLQVTRDEDGMATLHVLTEGWGTPSWFAHTLPEDKALRLVELLLAAAPHLADLLDTSGGDVDPAAMYRVKQAVAEAGESR